MFKECTRIEIERHLQKARVKHPVFAKNYRESFLILSEEIGEAAIALNEKNTAQFLEEVGDALAVCIRILDGEIVEIDKRKKDG